MIMDTHPSFTLRGHILNAFNLYLRLVSAAFRRRKVLVSSSSKTTTASLIQPLKMPSNDDGNNNKPYHTVDILLSAVIDENLSLDGVYFLLRREPDILQKLLSSSTKTNTTTTSTVEPNHNTHKSNSSDGDNSSNGLMGTTIDPRKRKRE
mmetsp:Transcript_28244/g.31638  ORF Transcript_28244/g.31638 Transcript_28244/m.31638 type:complete len:150 (+) Transcript_28244:388-837(+)